MGAQRLARTGAIAKNIIQPPSFHALPTMRAARRSALLPKASHIGAGLSHRYFSSTSARSAAHEMQDRTDIFEGQAERGLRMLMFGKPGSGKGTLSGRLLKHYDISFVSTGDVLRQEIAEKTEIGRRAEDIVKSGGLVPDELMLEIVMAELDRLQGKSWIIDGFPRTLHQGSLLDKVLNEERRPFNMIVHIDVPDQVIMSRIAARWVHLPSGRVYNTTFSAPKVPGKDDVTGEPLVQRPDDTPAVFSKRLEAYYGSTEPLLNYFSTTYPRALKTLKGTTSDEVRKHPSRSSFLKLPNAFKYLTYGARETQACSASSGSQYAAGESGYTGEDRWEQESRHDMERGARGAGTGIDQDLGDSTGWGQRDARAATGKSDIEIESEAMITEKRRNAANNDQLWPQLQALVEPYGLRRSGDLSEDQVSPVRQKADDLREPDA